MATRSNIAYKTPEGKIRSVYCHWDGYPEHNGEMLRRYYTEARKIAQMVELGSISYLRKNVFPVGEGHTFENPQEDVTVYYGRDRGETGQETREYDDIPSWIDDMEEYAYLWDGTQWLVNDHGERDANGFPVFDFVDYKIRPDIMENMGWDKA